MLDQREASFKVFGVAMDTLNTHSTTLRIKMAIYRVFSQSVTLKYKSSLFSKSTIFSVTTSFLTVVLPFLIAYRSQGFWLKSWSYREQPRVHFKHQYFIYLQTEHPDSPILCTNLPADQHLNYCTLIKSREEDWNKDGKNDQLSMEVRVEVPGNLSIFSLRLLLLFDYTLHKQSLLQMESAGYFQFQSGLPFGRLHVSGDLKLSQKSLLTTGGVRDVRYNESIFGLSSSDPTAMYNLRDALINYSKREVTTVIENVYQTWSGGATSDEPFTMTLTIFYPEDLIHGKPSFWQIIKWAWMQYVAILTVSRYVCRSAKSYVFSNHLVPAMQEVPWKKCT